MLFPVPCEFLASYPTHEGPNLPVPGSQFEPKLGRKIPGVGCTRGAISRTHLEIIWRSTHGIHFFLPRGFQNTHASPGHTPQTDTQSHRAHRIESQHNQADPQTHRQDHNGYVSGAWTHLLTPLPRGGRESSQIQWWRPGSGDANIERRCSGLMAMASGPYASVMAAASAWRRRLPQMEGPQAGRHATAPRW